MPKNKNLIESSHDVLNEGASRKFDRIADSAIRLEKLIDNISFIREVEGIIGKSKDLGNMISKYEEFMDALADIEMNIESETGGLD
jgi:hypothetical protein